MDQVSIKYTNDFQCKTLPNLPKFAFLVRKQTIWQPWFGGGENFFAGLKKRVMALKWKIN
jgi:hypothetical protein